MLSQRGVRLIHICPRQPKETFASTKFIEIGAGANLLQKAIIFVRIVVQTLLFCPDIIYVHQTVWMNKLGGKLAHMLRKPVVLDMHGSATQEDEAHPGAEDLAIIQQKERKALNGADLVIVVSQELKDFVQKRFGVAGEFSSSCPTESTGECSRRREHAQNAVMKCAER